MVKVMIKDFVVTNTVVCLKVNFLKYCFLFQIGVGFGDLGQVFYLLIINSQTLLSIHGVKFKQ